jgi:hypothetical protein
MTSAAQVVLARTWLNDRGKVSSLDRLVRDRQAQILRRRGTIEHIESAYSVQILTAGVVDSATTLQRPTDQLRQRRLMIECCLLAELLASSLCPDIDRAGGIFELVHARGEGTWRDWNHLNRPLVALRNAVLHPGQIGNNDQHLGSALGTLHDYLEGERRALAVKLHANPSALFSLDMIEWALLKLNAAGDFYLRTAEA